MNFVAHKFVPLRSGYGRARPVVNQTQAGSVRYTAANRNSYNMHETREAMPEQFLYLTTTGRVTGQPREIEIWFVESSGNFYLLAEHFRRAQWVRNIVQNPPVRVRVGDQEFEATARVLDEDRDREIWQTAQRLSREKYGWGEGLPVEIVRDE